MAGWGSLGSLGKTHTMKHIFTLFVFLGVVRTLSAQCLYISEYIEGSGNNKCIELFNGTGGSVDLAAGGYAVNIYSNGNSTAGYSISLSGILADGDVFVICHSSALAGMLAQSDLTSGSLIFNGDDAIELVNTVGTLDVVGQIGNDPGTEWTGSGCPQGTADGTLQRKLSLICPSFDGQSSFNPGTEWDCFATDTYSDLGSHTIASCILYDLNVVQTSCNNGTATALLDISTLNPTSANFQLTVTPDPGGLSGLYPYSSLPVSLSGFVGDDLTNYSFDVADESDPSCITDQLNGISFDCPVADELHFSVVPGGCEQVNSLMIFEVCAIEGATGKIQPDYTGTISLALSPGGTGNFSGSMTETAVNGCADFQLSYDTPESISLIASDGVLTNATTGVVQVQNICPRFFFTAGVLNPCGDDSQNEFIAGKTGSIPVEVGDLVFASIDPSSGQQPNTNFTWSASGAEDGGNPSESCGVIGLQCNRILDINDPVDGPVIANLVSQLNSQAGCSPNLFVAPTGPNLGLLPPFAQVVFFPGAGGNPGYPIAPGFDDPATNLDFSIYCGAGPVHVIFGYHKNPTTTFGFFANSGSRTYQVHTAGTLTADITYPSASGTSEAEMVDDQEIYSFGVPCVPPNLFTGQVLGVDWLWFEGDVDGTAIHLQWEITHDDTESRIEIERYNQESIFEKIGEVVTFPQSHSVQSYNYTDLSPFAGKNAYRLKYISADGDIDYSQVIEKELIRGNDFEILSLYPNPAKGKAELKIYSEKIKQIQICVRSLTGKSIFIRRFDLLNGVNTITLDLSNLIPGIYLYEIRHNSGFDSGKILVQ